METPEPVICRDLTISALGYEVSQISESFEGETNSASGNNNGATLQSVETVISGWGRDLPEALRMRQKARSAARWYV